MYICLDNEDPGGFIVSPEDDMKYDKDGYDGFTCFKQQAKHFYQKKYDIIVQKKR